MLLKSKDGIFCDVCGQIYKDMFTYYSFESIKISVDATTKRISQENKDLDIDVCEKCYKAAEEKVRNNLAKSAVVGTVKCDFCTTLMTGTFNYHRLLVHKVVVDKNQKTDGPASVQMNFMDFNLDDLCFTGLTSLAVETRQKIKATGEWS